MDGFHEEEPQNKDPEIIGDIFDTVLGVLQQYGWFILLVFILGFYLYGKLQSWLPQRSQQHALDSYKKLDSGAALERLEAMERARLRMQAKHDEESKRYAERLKEKEEEKRKQRVEEWNKLQKGQGYHSKVKAPQTEAPKPSTLKSQPKKPLRPEYNPLMGGSSSSGGGGGGACYRPSRRGGPSMGG